MSPRSRAWVALCLAGCVRTWPARFDAEDRHARVFETVTRVAGAVAPPLSAPRGALPARGLTLVSEWGDDRGRYDDRYRLASTLADGSRVLWSPSALLRVDRDGAPLRRAPWPSRFSGASPSRVAVDPRGRWVAVRDARDLVWLGALDDLALTPLREPPRGEPRDAGLVDAPEPPTGVEATWVSPWRGERVDGAWPPEALAGRLLFSPDGARLASATAVWELSSRRPLLTFAVDEALLAVDAALTRAVVATLATRTVQGRIGSQCGFIPTSRSLVLVRAEARDLTADHPPTPLSLRSWSEPVAGFDEPLARADATTAFHPVTQVAVSDAGEVAAAVDADAWWLSRDASTPLRWPRAMREVRALTFARGGLIAQTALSSGGRVLPVSARYGRDGATTRALVGALHHPPNAAGRIATHDEGWSVWDLAAARRVRALPDPGRLNLSATEQARITDDGAAVLREEAGGATVFLVERDGAWRRVRAAGSGPSLSRWWMRRDGRYVVTWRGDRVALVDLASGASRWEREASGREVHVAFAGDRVYVGADALVRALSLDGDEVARVDLSGRFDRVTALAASDDGATLAVGTARGRVFVLRAE